MAPPSLPTAAGVVELVDAPDSKSGSARSVGSIPTARTTEQLPAGQATLPEPPVTASTSPFM